VLPLTPLHYPVAYFLHKLNRKLSLPGLAVGSMFPDFEIPVLSVVLGTQVRNRLVLHSLLGGAVVGTILSTMFTVLVYPFLIRSIFKVDGAKVKGRCRMSIGLIASCFLGNLSHVLLDTVNHLYNPVFWPFQPWTISQVCLFLGGPENASLLLSPILIVLFIALLISQRRSLWENLLVGT